MAMDEVDESALVPLRRRSAADLTVRRGGVDLAALQPLSLHRPRRPPWPLRSSAADLDICRSRTTDLAVHRGESGHERKGEYGRSSTALTPPTSPSPVAAPPSTNAYTAWATPPLLHYE
uniref:Uncharacterized protein n=1 Tax=Oryza meridionalis TaxID=40149 RepID=A0A0E0E531_9ORYZ